MPEAILKHVPGMANAAAVPVRDAGALCEEIFLNEFVANSRPCLIKGAVRHWPAFIKWRNREYLKTLCDHDVFYWPHERHVTNRRTEVDQQVLPFADAVDRAATDEVAAFGTALPSKLDDDLGGFSFSGPRAPGFLYPAHRTFFF